MLDQTTARTSRFHDLRLPLALIALAMLAVYFWFSSRYPALNQKAIMGGDTPVSGLSFDIFYEIAPDSSLGWELVANSVNWIYTNLKGMTFGVLFGAAALTLLALVRKRSFNNGFANSLLGTALGAPLGVCVNCAVPIAVGLHMGRMRLETTLSAMLASPTLNVIVVTMTFALLPIHLAVIKLVLALVMVLLVVPLLCRFVLKDETDSTRGGVAISPAQLARTAQLKGFAAWIGRALAPVEVEPGDYGPLRAARWFVKTYARSFFFVFIITVPMMLAAAVLGAVVATFVSPVELIGVFPYRPIWLVFAAMIPIALVASFVPAPIALDVILTAILLNVGMDSSYAMVTLVGLGSFSVYAFIVLWRSISPRTALAMWGAVLAMAVLAGVIAKFTGPALIQYYHAQQMAALNAVDHIDWPVVPDAPAGIDAAQLAPLLKAQWVSPAPLPASVDSSRGSAVTLAGMGANMGAPAGGANPGAPPIGTSPFKRIVGTDIGLDERGVNTPARQFGYNMMRGGLAAADVQGDGWTDIVTRRPVGAKGLSLYANVGGRFVREKLNLGPVDQADVFNVGLADLDGDAMPDLVVSTIGKGAYAFFNRGGSFSDRDAVQLKPADASVVTALSFADLDGDGDVDMIFGNWAPRGISEAWKAKPLIIRNEIYWNDGNRHFRSQRMPGVPGQTLTSLISDVNGDGYPDYYKGDDAASTDEIVPFGKGGSFHRLPRDRQPFPYYTRSSMSFDEGDWNNDLRTDYYSVQIATGKAPGTNSKHDSRSRTLFEICAGYGSDLHWSTEQIKSCAADLLSQYSIRDSRSGKFTDSCKRPTNPRDRALCGATSLLSRVSSHARKGDGDRRNYAACRKQFARYPELAVYCSALVEPNIGVVPDAQIKAQYRPSMRNGNTLMTGGTGGAYKDDAKTMGVRAPGWSWNSRFVDLDQDGRQDLLVMTGIWLNAAASTSNVFYHNNGRGFDEKTLDYGFWDMSPSYSYVTLDYDRDGDLDVVRDNSALRMIVHRSDHPVGPALTVSLRDRKGNSMGIGAAVYVCTDGETVVRPGKCQMRHIKASGGYMSSDPIAAHFGLGPARSVSLIAVRWPDGEVSRLRPQGLAKGEVVVSRS